MPITDFYFHLILDLEYLTNFNIVLNDEVLSCTRVDEAKL